MSGFDLRAIAALLGTRLNRLSPKIFDVTGPKDWRAAKKGVDTIASVAIGSPIASYATDRFMCSMLGLDVKKETATDRLPFFIVRRRKERLLTSGFVRTRLHAIRRNPTVADRISEDQRAPVTGIMLLINGMLGLINRVMPQMSIFNIGFPLSAFAGYMAVLLTIPESASFFVRAYSRVELDIARLVGG